MDYQDNQYQGNVSSPPPPQYMEPHRGTMILVFGILGLVICGIFAILAWIFGNQDLQKMRSGVMDPAGMSNTNIGRILGMVGCGLWVLGIIFYFGVFAAALGSM